MVSPLKLLAALAVRGAVVGAVAMFAGSCAGSSWLPKATDALASHAPGSNVEKLAEGRRLYVARCSGCHNLPLPASQTAEEWASEMDDMGQRAKLGPEQQAAVVAYLQAVVRSQPQPTE
jgi:mono/diheme cytochrome c family protein